MKMDIFMVDCQNDFFPPGGSLAIQGVTSIRSNLCKVFRFAISNGLVVLISKDTHIKDDPEFQYFPPHCIEGTHGSGLIDEVGEIAANLKDRTICIPHRSSGTNSASKASKAGVPESLEGIDVLMFEKNKIDIFSEESLASYFLSHHPDAVLICGVATDYCIKAAALGLREGGFKVYLLLDAIAGVSEVNSRASLEMMRDAGVHFITTDNLAHVDFLRSHFQDLETGLTGKRQWIPLH